MNAVDVEHPQQDSEAVIRSPRGQRSWDSMEEERRDPLPQHYINIEAE